MLAVFDKSVAQSPVELQSPNSSSESALKDGFLAKHFASVYDSSISVSLGDGGFMAYSTKRPNFIWQRLFGTVEGIFCLFEGNIENITNLKQEYGLGKMANEVIIVIAAYSTLRDRGPYPADQVIKDIRGKYAFILYDSSTRFAFFASDSEGSVPLFWGTDSVGDLVLSDDISLLKLCCNKSFAPFPKGCFFTSSRGLRSFEHPLNEMKAVTRVDSLGEVCGSDFNVDLEKKSPRIPRVGSTAKWTLDH